GDGGDAPGNETIAARWRSAMPEDRLERALQALRDESVDEATLESARERVWDAVRLGSEQPRPADPLGIVPGVSPEWTESTPQMTGVVGATCAEFRPELSTHLAGALDGARRVLMDDHLSRC